MVREDFCCIAICEKKLQVQKRGVSEGNLEKEDQKV